MAAVSPEQVCVDAIIREALAPRLKEVGFKKVARTWFIQQGSPIKIVNVQLSSGNSHTKASFTVNLGVRHAEFHMLRNPWDEASKKARQVKEYQCDARMRIGELMGLGDLWWTVGASSKLKDATSNDFKSTFEKYVPPWLNSFHDLSDLFRHFVDQSMHFDAALAAHLLGRSDVKSHLVTAHSTPNPHFLPT